MTSDEIPPSVISPEERARRRAAWKAAAPERALRRIEREERGRLRRLAARKAVAQRLERDRITAARSRGEDPDAGSINLRRKKTKRPSSHRRDNPTVNGASNSTTPYGVASQTPQALRSARIRADAKAQKLAERRAASPGGILVGTVDESGRMWNGKAWVYTALVPNAWKPGQSGNPRGRPKRRTFGEDAYELLMNELDEVDKRKLAGLLRVEVHELERVDAQRFIAAVWIRRAMAGDADAFREIFDRRDPKPRRIEVSGRGGAPLAAAIAAGRMTEKDAVDVYRALVEGDPDDGGGEVIDVGSEAAGT